MLQEQVLAFVEGALQRTSPGNAFTSGVVAVLPAVATSAKAATMGAALTKGGPAAKGIVTSGSLGVPLALLGSAYVSLRAEADNSKSPRERQFVLQMFGMRIIFILLSFVLVFVAMKFTFFRVPIHFDYLAAALFFCFCFDAAFFSNCQSYRRQQIQIEDNTFVDAEWRNPGRFTDSVRPKFGRLSAFGIISGSMVGIMLGGNVLAGACIAVAFVVLLQIVSFVRRHHIPRFQPLHLQRVSLVSPILTGLLTLGFLYRPQYVAHTLPHTIGNSVNRESPTEILVFNLIVILAYTGFFIGLLAWRRKRVRACRPCASPDPSGLNPEHLRNYL
jgi:hypothetical protein